jgi:hypothetical protein
MNRSECRQGQKVKILSGRYKGKIARIERPDQDNENMLWVSLYIPGWVEGRPMFQPSLNKLLVRYKQNRQMLEFRNPDKVVLRQVLIGYNSIEVLK